MDDETRVIRSFGIGLLEAMIKRRILALSPELFDIMYEWIALPSVQADPVVRELVEAVNLEGEKEANRPNRQLNRAERRRQKV